MGTARVAVVAALLLSATLTCTTVAAQEKPPARVPPDQYGRYVITFSPIARADTFLVDTQTGKVWQLTRHTYLEGEPLVFEHVERIDSDAQFLQWLKSQIRKQTEEPK